MAIYKVDLNLNGKFMVIIQSTSIQVYLTVVMDRPITRRPRCRSGNLEIRAVEMDADAIIASFQSMLVLGFVYTLMIMNVDIYIYIHIHTLLHMFEHIQWLTNQVPKLYDPRSVSFADGRSWHRC